MGSVSVLFLLLFLLSAAVRAQQKHSNSISSNSSLSPNTHPTAWFSPSGVFAFGFYPQGRGFAVGIWLLGARQNTIVWTAYRDDPPVSSNDTLEFTGDGRLLLRTQKGKEKLIADVHVPAVSASMLDSGNFVLYGNDSDVIWESFDFPTDTLLGGQNLSSGDELVSSVLPSDHTSGRFLFAMQGDGNLVAYPVNSSHKPEDSYWNSGTAYAGFGVKLNLNRRGLLCLIDRGSCIKNLVNSSHADQNKTTIYRATLDTDGILRLYSHSIENNASSGMSIKWSALSDQCAVHGFCGFNSYCSGIGNKSYCRCFPGFVVSGNEFNGCYRNFSEDDCIRGTNPATLYNISTLENINWGDYPYFEMLMGKDDCGKSCLKDCNCGAAMYLDGSCKKFKLPLRYGGQSQNYSSLGFFKVTSRKAEVPDQPPPIPNAVGPTFVTESKKTLISVLAVSLGSIACVCSVIAIFSFVKYRNRVHRYKKLSETANLHLTEEFTLRSFSYDELEKATEGFREELGRGSYATVYKGALSGSGGNKIIAVKKLEEVLEDGEREFRAEMMVIGRTHHRNLVRLLGFCVEGSRRLLVYEYMSNGSLADLLFKAERPPSWRERVKIALDVAKGILYLHDECEGRIIHCNIKPQNILMDDSWTAKISDFGLAKLLIPNQTETSTRVRGIEGYLAPEWQKNALISVKADIYSFGIVLLEMVCCRRNIEVDVSTADEIILSGWVYNCFVGKELNKLVADENMDMMIVERMVKVGLWCIQDDPARRPSIRNVILMLEGTMDIPVPPSPAPSHLIS